MDSDYVAMGMRTDCRCIVLHSTPLCSLPLIFPLRSIIVIILKWFWILFRGNGKGLSLFLRSDYHSTPLHFIIRCVTAFDWGFWVVCHGGGTGSSLHSIINYLWHELWLLCTWNGNGLPRQSTPLHSTPFYSIPLHVEFLPHCDFPVVAHGVPMFLSLSDSSALWFSIGCLWIVDECHWVVTPPQFTFQLHSKGILMSLLWDWEWIKTAFDWQAGMVDQCTPFHRYHSEMMLNMFSWEWTWVVTTC